jgi:hypothetical protein
VLTVGIATSAVYAQQDQPPAPQSRSTGSHMEGNGMMDGPDNMMGGGMNGGMMKQMSQMMEHCNNVMQSHMQPPNSRFPKPEQAPNKG